MTNEADLIASVATKHGVPDDAVAEALRALRRGNGTMAQFSHPAFGGMAQWSRGGMSMVGDMFNSRTKATFNAVMEDLAGSLAELHDHADVEIPQSPKGVREAASGSADRWPPDFGAPASSGSQNDMRYAFFPSVCRLVVESNGRRTVYDTGSHKITGVSQQQSGTQSLKFSSQDGDVPLDALALVV
ncbi:hypothetical protein [Bosea sp. PAMC 26642]|uniref:hypothetical protein n=1 Tax=Bosea sp. (strain PAMC 26642) TaxID=1792307 RepID=UPI00077036DA|nr:hypothetical protein [Bosea sp. PAMC 26642]AMJ62784.1 hypothetical protein AXW83_23030 [Bosea sp. PAMC 26642]